jgi:hypothetical protein
MLEKMELMNSALSIEAIVSRDRVDSATRFSASPHCEGPIKARRFRNFQVWFTAFCPI